MTISKRHRLTLLISIALTAATLAVYAQVKNHDFIDFDDEDYITANAHVNSGLTLQNIVWAFTSSHSNNWHPLTWLSHMADVELFGLHPAGHHLVNVLLHTVNVILLFLLLSRMTGALWKSAFVAALFALHPLHVESVAWAAERKDVLSTCFWMLTLWMYLRYVQKQDWKRYGMVLTCFALGLMAKQMLVTLPFVMLLLDFWPLGRFSDVAGQEDRPEHPKRHARKNGHPKRDTVPDPCRKARGGATAVKRWKQLLAEKIPLFALAALASVTVFLVQLKSGVLFNLNPFPLQIRIENALVSYVAYIGKMFWPAPLAVFYPHPLATLHLWQVAGALLLLTGVTVLCWILRRKPYLMVGWFWYLGTLAPVIGLIQVGVQAMADRYTYIPLIGLFMIIAWGLPDLIGKWPYRKPALIALSAVTLISCALLTKAQIRTWKDREALYAHAVLVIRDNYWAYNNLGAAVAARGNLDEAMIHFSKSLAIMPFYPGANKNMAVALYNKERFGEAIPYIHKALLLQPRNQEYHIILGVILMNMGKGEDAVLQLREALRMNPDAPDAREALQEALAKFPETKR